jgi:aryl-alcohol dehydrogenase-like predicted oxidoreductase
MRYKLLGRSGLRVSEISLGTMTFGETWGWGASKSESIKTFDLFTKAGGNFIDTSVNYTDGTSEKFLGDFIKTNRDYFVVASKYTLTKPPNGGGNSRKNTMKSSAIDMGFPHGFLDGNQYVFGTMFDKIDGYRA